MEKRFRGYLIVSLLLIFGMYSALFYYIVTNVNQIQADSNQLLFSPENSPGACSDGDGGFYPSTASTLESLNYNYGEKITLNDYCLDSDTVVEYSCDLNNTYSARSYYCKSGCVQGVCSAERKSFLLRADNFIRDVSTGFNYTNIEKYVDNAWLALCLDKKGGDTCFVEDLDLMIDNISAGSDKWAKFHYGSAGKTFRPVYDNFRNRLYLPIQSDLPSPSISFVITDPDGPILQNFNISWSNFTINISKGDLLSGKEHSFNFHSEGNAVFLDVTMAQGFVSFPVLYGDGNQFTGIGEKDFRLLATSDDYNLFYNYTRGDRQFVLSTGRGGANNTICSASYIANVSNCLSGDKIVKYFVSNYSCGIPLPENVTLNRCDFDGNGIIGSLSDIDSNFNVSFYDSGFESNLTRNFSGTRDLSFQEGGNVRVEFSFNFNNSDLDLTKIYVRKQSNSDKFGSLIINGLSGVNKTVFVDKKSNSSDSVCVKTSEIEDVSQFSDDCDSSNEHLVSCDGVETGDGYICNDLGSSYSIEGLSRSAVLEFIHQGFSGSTSCVSSWVCGEWEECIAGQQIRVCTDSRGCGSSVGKPSESQDCSAQENQSISQGSSSQSLNSGNSKLVGAQLYFWIIVGIIVLSILIVITLIILGISSNKKVERRF